MHRSLRLAPAIAVLALAPAAAASAHVTLQPRQAPAGEFKRLDVRVPNESDEASTRKVVVQFPAGILSVSYEAVAGWRTTVALAKLAEPVELHGEQRTEEVDTVTFTATGKGVRPGQFQDFGLSLRLPDAAGTALTFKAVQTYSDGEVVRWIGAPGSDRPAPQVQLVAATADAGAAQASAAADGGEDDDGADVLTIVALVLGALALLAGGAALVTARR